MLTWSDLVFLIILTSIANVTVLSSEKNSLYIEKRLQWIRILSEIVKENDWITVVGFDINSRVKHLLSLNGPSGIVIGCHERTENFPLMVDEMTLHGLSNRSFLMTASPKFSFYDVVDVNHDLLQHCLIHVNELDDCLTFHALSVTRMYDLVGKQCSKVFVAFNEDIISNLLDILMSGFNFLERCRPIIIIETMKSAESQAVIELLSSLDYDLYWNLFIHLDQDKHVDVSKQDDNDIEHLSTDQLNEKVILDHVGLVAVPRMEEDMKIESSVIIKVIPHRFYLFQASY